MSTAMLATKGQVTIPKNVRGAMHLQVGDRIEFVRVNDDLYETVAVTKEVGAVERNCKKQ